MPTLPIGSMPSSVEPLVRPLDRAEKEPSPNVLAAVLLAFQGREHEVGRLLEPRPVEPQRQLVAEGGSEVDDTNASVGLRPLDSQGAAGEVHVAALKVEGLLDPQASARQRCEHRPPAAMQVRLRSPPATPSAARAATNDAGAACS